MKKAKLMLIGYAVVEAITAIILAVWNILGVKVLEETRGLEIGKRIIVSLAIMVIVGVIFYAPIGTWASRKADGLDKKKKPEQQGRLEDTCGSETCAYRGKGVCSYKEGEFCPMYEKKK